MGGGSCVTAPVTVSIPLRCASRGPRGPRGAPLPRSPRGPAIPQHVKNRHPASI
ncbi:hypothetical protein SNL152K_4504 [Streptomyces sp. NL15-2K]|nr:hypothetical protein SNL152K_4504 [Streptomyces sp. NL15-2K]